MAFSPKGAYLGSADLDGCTIRMWNYFSVIRLVGHGSSQAQSLEPGDYGTHCLLPLWSTLKEHTTWITAYASSDDGSPFAIGDDHNDQTVRQWNTILGKHIRTLRGHDWTVSSLVFSPNNSILASGSGDYTVRLWDVESGAIISILSGHDNYVKGVEFTNDGSRVLTRTHDQTLTWDLLDPAAIGPISCVEEDKPDDSHLMHAYSDGFTLSMGDGRWLWMSKGKQHNHSARRVTLVFEEYRITGFALHSDRLALVCANSQVLILDISRLKRQFSCDSLSARPSEHF